MPARVQIDRLRVLPWHLAASTAAVEVMDQHPFFCRLDEAWLRRRAQEESPVLLAALCHAQGLLSATNKKPCLKQLSKALKEVLKKLITKRTVRDRS